jgi:hypothetical protein
MGSRTEEGRPQGGGQFAVNFQEHSDMIYRLHAEALKKMNIDPADLKKLNKVPLIVAAIGFCVNILLIFAMNNNGWIKGTALADGQPFGVYLSLGGATFGPATDVARDNKYFCRDIGDGACDEVPSMWTLDYLCHTPLPTESKFENLDVKFTPIELWCQAQDAGSTAGKLLGFSYIPGLAATILTLLYAAKEIEIVQNIFEKAKMLGLTEELQKHVVVGGWAALWLFMFFAMTLYCALIPDSLGWGDVELEGSFGLLRFSFILISISGAVLTSHLYKLWHMYNVIEAWEEFVETPRKSWKFALYIELLVQMILYFFLTIYMIDWAAMLTVVAFNYLDEKKKNYKIMYMVLVSVSILFDLSRLFALPSEMTSSDRFGNTIWYVILFLKPAILSTIVLYEREIDDGFHKLPDPQTLPEPSGDASVTDGTKYRWSPDRIAE